MCTLPLLKAICRECYSEPEAVYQTLRRAGMDLVTVSDHDSIGAAEALRRHPDFFLSEEVTCRMPSGNELHVGVYDLTERQHVEIQRRRNDLPRLVAYLNEQGLFYSVNHAFSALTGRRSMDDFIWLDGAFPGVEVRNGHVPERSNRLAERMAERLGKRHAGRQRRAHPALAGKRLTRACRARATRRSFSTACGAGRRRCKADQEVFGD